MTATWPWKMRASTAPPRRSAMRRALAPPCAGEFDRTIGSDLVQIECSGRTTEALRVSVCRPIGPVRSPRCARSSPRGCDSRCSRQPFAVRCCAGAGGPFQSRVRFATLLQQIPNATGVFQRKRHPAMLPADRANNVATTLRCARLVAYSDPGSRHTCGLCPQRATGAGTRTGSSA